MQQRLRKANGRRSCVFCGATPEQKNKEHVIPKWLIKATGNTREPVPLGVNFSTSPPTPRRYPLMSLVLPACEMCNASFAKLEALTAPIVRAILSREHLVENQLHFLLDWFDKVRIGLWLWELSTSRSMYKIEPNFHVEQRIGQKDRLLLMVFIEDNLSGLKLFGTNTFSFSFAPCCFGMVVNNVAFLNISYDFMLSRQLGFPFVGDIKALGKGKKDFGLLQEGTAKVSPPMLPGRLQLPGAVFGQCSFAHADGSEEIRCLYDTDFVRRHSGSMEGASSIFVGHGRDVTTFRDMQGSIYDIAGRAQRYDRDIGAGLPLEVFRIQRDIMNRWPDPSWGGDKFGATIKSNKKHALGQLQSLIEPLQRARISPYLGWHPLILGR